MADLQRYQPGYFLAAVHEISIGLKQRSATVTYINWRIHSLYRPSGSNASNALNLASTSRPITTIVVIAAIERNAASTAYSTTVAPLSSRKNRHAICLTCTPPGQPANGLSGRSPPAPGLSAPPSRGTHALERSTEHRHRQGGRSTKRDSLHLPKPDALGYSSLL